MRLAVRAAILCCMAIVPAAACLNDQVVAESEEEFRARYGAASYLMRPPAWWPGPGTGLLFVAVVAVVGVVLLERSERHRARDAQG